MIGYIIGGVAMTAASIIIVTDLLARRSRRKEYSDWQVGDKVAIKDKDGLFTLQGWEKTAFYLENKDGSTVKLAWKKLDFNKSATWRRNHQSCEKVMGTKPGFSPELGKNSSSSQKIDGKPIELLTEIECQIYLKQALETEDYELAEKIRKQMEKYR